MATNKNNKFTSGTTTNHVHIPIYFFKEGKKTLQV